MVIKERNKRHTPSISKLPIDFGTVSIINNVVGSEVGDG